MYYTELIDEIHDRNIFGKISVIMFEIKSYTRKELAMLYFPNCSTPRAAYINLWRWLKEQKGMDEFFAKIHGKKILSRTDVKTIVELLGEP